ncbi:PREDICTED: uncharacterized protein LOC105143475 [Acromyrmex echinatior]|uniref:uncharacterized protein LOC105143475 n=1 Tax=Acromyrmex echinatior TaxID=103372 RepID=UPI000580FD94|nr:PREDICTED: uncharacterized protein LOC105143475 [Acromyrmex echinatior]
MMICILSETDSLFRTITIFCYAVFSFICPHFDTKVTSAYNLEFYSLIFSEEITEVAERMLLENDTPIENKQRMLKEMFQQQKEQQKHHEIFWSNKSSSKSNEW